MKRLLHWINNLNTVFWSRVVQSTYIDVKSLCVFRIIVGVFLLCIYSPGFSWIANSPQAFFNPPFPSIASFFHSFPGREFFLIIDLILLITAVFITLGIKARISTLIYAFTSIIGFNFQSSFGKIDHTILLYAMLFCMAFSGWGEFLAVVPDKAVNINSTAKSLSLLSVLICFGFFSAAFLKTVFWVNLDFNSTGTGKWFYSQFYIVERQQLFLAPFIKYLPFWTFKIMDFIAVCFELSPLLFLFISRKAWRIWILTACVFHVFNTLMLNINFIFVAATYLAFANFTGWFKKVRYLSTLKSVKALIFACLSLIVIIKVYYSFNSIIATNIFWPDNLTINNLCFALLIWVIVIMILFKSTFKRTATDINKYVGMEDMTLPQSSVINNTQFGKSIK